ncbi:unnamed protein product, partial [marine sediment metagenome]
SPLLDAVKIVVEMPLIELTVCVLELFEDYHKYRQLK